MTYKIEKNVPIADGRHKATYPFRDMEVGDSFFVPIDSCFEFESGARRASLAATHRCAAYRFGRENNLKFKTTVQTDGLRIWRIK